MNPPATRLRIIAQPLQAGQPGIAGRPVPLRGAVSAAASPPESKPSCPV
jgi:hypothetical protein